MAKRSRVRVSTAETVTRTEPQPPTAVEVEVEHRADLLPALGIYTGNRLERPGEHVESLERAAEAGHPDMVSSRQRQGEVARVELPGLTFVAVPDPGVVVVLRLHSPMPQGALRGHPQAPFAVTDEAADAPVDLLAFPGTGGRTENAQRTCAAGEQGVAVGEKGPHVRAAQPLRLAHPSGEVPLRRQGRETVTEGRHPDDTGVVLGKSRNRERAGFGTAMAEWLDVGVVEVDAVLGADPQDARPVAVQRGDEAVELAGRLGVQVEEAAGVRTCVEQSALGSEPDTIGLGQDRPDDDVVPLGRRVEPRHPVVGGHVEPRGRLRHRVAAHDVVVLESPQLIGDDEGVPDKDEHGAVLVRPHRVHGELCQLWHSRPPVIPGGVVSMKPGGRSSPQAAVAIPVQVEHRDHGRCSC